MKKNKNLFLVIGALAGVAIITILLMLALFYAVPSVQPIVPSSDTDTSTSTPSNTASTTNAETPPFADSHNMLDECTTFKQADAADQGGTFQKGTILVTFQKKVKYSDAIDLVEENNLQVTSNSEARQSFESGNWFTVKVPSGEEYKWMCIFESSDVVARTTREPIFDLHQ